MIADPRLNAQLPVNQTNDTIPSTAEDRPTTFVHVKDRLGLLVTNCGLRKVNDGDKISISISIYFVQKNNNNTIK